MSEGAGMTEPVSQHDPIHRPRHYIGRRTEAWEIAEDWCLGFHLGNALKYVLRCARKGAREQDLEKAIAYLRRLGDHDDILRHLRTDPRWPRIAASAVADDYELTDLLAEAVHHIREASLAPDASAARGHCACAAQSIRDELAIAYRANQESAHANAR